MKLKSVLFAFVLLLLTAAVCAAQSPMGFSPDEFYQNFQKEYAILEGPECSYVKLDEEAGAFIIVNDELFVNLSCKENELTEIYIVFPIVDDADIWADNRAVIYSTIIGLAWELGISLDSDDLKETSEMVVDLIWHGASKEYYGFHLESGPLGDDYATGFIRITKSDDNAPAPMGFSPYEFYEDFVEINAIFDGPECSYKKGDEDQGADITISDDVFFKLFYTGNDVTMLGLFLNLESDDENFADVFNSVIPATLITLATESGVPLKEIDITEITDMIEDLFTNDSQIEYCGYQIGMGYSEHFGMDFLWAKKDATALSASKSQENDSQTPAVTAAPSESQGSNISGTDKFDALIDDFIADGVVPAGGRSQHVEDNTKEWALPDEYQLAEFDRLKNFVFSTTVSWASADENTEADSSGCTLMFRGNGTSDLHDVSLRMDGYVYLAAYRDGVWRFYKEYRYGGWQFEATHQFVVVANESKVTVYVDGVQTGSWDNVAVSEGSIGMTALSGTNKGFGTRCEWTDTYYYTWD
jgi:hypothetical protein